MMASLLAMTMALGAGPTVAQMRDHRRILVVAAASADDPSLRAQRTTLAEWTSAAADRDLTTVEMVGDSVSGSADDARVLRAIYNLPPGAFAVVLIGKDGHVAYRSATPVAAGHLQAMIDAMPMRRAGRR